MNDVELLRRIRMATDGVPDAAADLAAVHRRARSLRRRRTVGMFVAAAIGVAAIAWPLQQLGHLGQGAVPASPTDTPVEFASLDGWHTATASAAALPNAPAATAAVIANVPLAVTAEEFPPGVDNAFLDGLPSDGIAIVAQQLLSTRNPIPAHSGYTPATLPLNLSAGSRSTGGWEGLARSDMTQFHLSVLVDGRPVQVSAYLGTDEPDDAMLREVQLALDQLTVDPADAPTEAIDQFGISMPVPDGWYALLYAGDPTLIVSTQPLESLYWERTRRSLGTNDVTIELDESDALVELQGWAPLQDPLAVGDAERCDGCEALDDGAPPPDGHVLYERTFTTGGRAFTLLVEFGAEPSPAQIERVNGVLAGIAIQPAANPEYTPAPGTTRVGPIYDGDDVPAVRAGDANRTLHWDYEDATMQLPDGWTGRTYPVAGLERPMSLLAAGSWYFTPGGYCGPINALAELPSDGALVWVDGFGRQPPRQEVFTDKPARIDLSTARTDPSPCFAGADPYVFRWLVDGRAYVVHIAIGPGATPSTIAAATGTASSVT
jgi:hypothetical protein